MKSKSADWNQLLYAMAVSKYFGQELENFLAGLSARNVYMRKNRENSFAFIASVAFTAS